MKYLLVVEDNVREPDVLAGHVEMLHPAVVRRVPGQLVVPPLLDATETISDSICMRLERLFNLSFTISCPKRINIVILNLILVLKTLFSSF